MGTWGGVPVTAYIKSNANTPMEVRADEHAWSSERVLALEGARIVRSYADDEEHDWLQFPAEMVVRVEPRNSD